MRTSERRCQRRSTSTGWKPSTASVTSLSATNLFELTHWLLDFL